MSISHVVVILAFAVTLMVLVGSLTALVVAMAGSRIGRVLLAVTCLPIVLVLLGFLFLVVSRSSSHVQEVQESHVRVSRELQSTPWRQTKVEVRQYRQENGSFTSNESRSNDAKESETAATVVTHARPSEATVEVDTSAFPEVAAEKVTAEVTSDEQFTAGDVEEEAGAGKIAEDDAPPHESSGESLAQTHERPAWVQSPPNQEGDVHSLALCAGPFSTPSECEQALKHEVEKAVSGYNQWYIQQLGGSQRLLVWSPNYHIDWSDKGNRYHEVTESKILGKMHNVHMRLDFDEAYRRQLNESWRDTAKAQRLTRVALIFGGVLALLATLNSYLRLDTATEGCYTRRLQCAAVGAILALTGSGVVLLRWIPWM